MNETVALLGGVSSLTAFLLYFPVRKYLDGLWP